MKKKKKIVIFLLAFAGVSCGLYLISDLRNRQNSDVGASARANSALIEDMAQNLPEKNRQETGEATVVDSEEGDDAVDEDKLVEEFDAMTDKWAEPAGNDISLRDVAKYIEALKRLPKTRREECVQRALNLVPDENIMLLAGILLDKSFEDEIIQAVYGDVLNRSEDVKKPILDMIFKDRSHPCWADTAWILDVTGQLPKKK